MIPPKEPRYFPENSRLVSSTNSPRYLQRKKDNSVYLGSTPINILRLHDIILASIGSNLNLDNFERHLAGIAGCHDHLIIQAWHKCQQIIGMNAAVFFGIDLRNIVANSVALLITIRYLRKSIPCLDIRPIESTFYDTDMFVPLRHGVFNRDFGRLPTSATGMAARTLILKPAILPTP